MSWAGNICAMKLKKYNFYILNMDNNFNEQLKKALKFLSK